MTEIFEEVCPYYIAIGMSLDEYWNGSPHLVKYYRQSHRLQMEQQNQIAWIQGLYFKAALDSTLGTMFRSRGSKAIPYVEKPFDIFPKTEREKEQEAIEQRRKAVEYFNMLIRQQEIRKRSQKSGDIDAVNNRISGSQNNT